MDDNVPQAGGNVGKILLGLVERLETIDEEKKKLAAERREVLSETKLMGFDKTMVNQVVKVRAMDPQKRSEQEAMLVSYLDAIAVAEG